MRTLDLLLLRTFVVVAEQRGMTAAARVLHLTQGAVSQQIKKLEEAFDAPLLIRDRRGMRLAPLGERLFAKARQMLALNEQIWADVKGDAMQGRVRLGMPYDLVGAWIAPTLKTYVEANPQVELSLRCGSSGDLKTEIANGSLDVAIIEEIATAATGECLSIERLVWAGAKGGTAFLKSPLPVSLVADTCAFRAPVITALESQDRPWKTLFESGNLEATVAMVSSDLAVSVWLQSTLPNGLDILSPEAKLPQLPPFAISLHRAKGSAQPAVEELVRHIRQSLGRA
jgi:DNA-binding transcriptional LysR family regulator